MIYYLSIIVMALADRACGNGNDHIPKAPAAMIMGYACSVIVGHGAHWSAILYALGFWAARSIGLGNAVGPALTNQEPARFKTATNPGPEWWQYGLLLNSAWLSLAFLGMLWGCLIAGFTVWTNHHAWIFLPLCTAVIPAAVFLARGSWARQEYIRGALIGIGAWLL